jgi:hypothetical protein
MTGSATNGSFGRLQKSRLMFERYSILACDVVLTTRGAGASEPATGLHCRGSGTASYRRAQRLATLLARWVPARFRSLQGRLLDPRLLPFVPAPVSVLSFGSGVTVFLLDDAAAEEAKVLKVFRKSLGMPFAALVQHVQERRASYRRVASWYGGCGVVLPTQFLLLHGPLRSSPVAACIQPFIGGEKIDVFRDLTESELLNRLEQSAALRAQFRLFVDRTLRSASDEGASIDLVGHDNLVIAGHGDDCRLVLLDLGVYDFARKAARAPDSLEELRSRLLYLRRVCERIRT